MMNIIKPVFRYVRGKLIDLDEVRVVRFYNRQLTASMRSPEARAILGKITLTKQQEREIDEFWMEHYGQKITHLWHRYYTAFTGNFDVRYIPDTIYFLGMERLMNSKPEYVRVLEDKNLLPLIAKSAGIKTPEVIVSCTNGVLRDGENNIITVSEAVSILKDAGEVFYKPSLNSCGGASCCCVNYGTGGYTLPEQPDFVIQKRLRCHSSIAEIYSGCANTFRVVTYLWRGKVIHCPLVLRMGRGNADVDNASSGGIFIAVDDDGTLHTNARTEHGLSFSEHPDTHIVFAGRKISFTEELIAAAKKMHSQIPQVGMINWDFTIDQDGSPVMIEGNMFHGGGYFLVQESHECGIFGDKTPEILQWFREIQKAKRTERAKFMYGKILQH